MPSTIANSQPDWDLLRAERHAIDLAQFGQSVQAAAKLLGTAGHLAITGQYAKQQQALTVRMLAVQADALL